MPQIKVKSFGIEVIMLAGEWIKWNTRIQPNAHRLTGEQEQVGDPPQPDCEGRSIMVRNTWPCLAGSVISNEDRCF